MLNVSSLSGAGGRIVPKDGRTAPTLPQARRPAVTGSIPRDFIDQLLARTDIVDLISEFVPLRKAGQNYQARCPFHEEKTPSFSVSPSKQFFYCFGCGAKGSAIGFLMDHGRMGFVEAVHELANRLGLDVPSTGANHSPPIRHLYERLSQAAAYFRQQLQGQAGAAARTQTYLAQRGLSEATIADYELGYAPPGRDNLLRAAGKSPQELSELIETGLVIRADDGRTYDRFRDRILFPIHDVRGRVLGFGGRVLGDEIPKYLNSPETPTFHKGRELYGLYQALQATRKLERVWVVEGYMDVLALAQFGLRNVVATLGTAITAAHFTRLLRHTSDIVFCFDGDAAGRKAAWRALETALPMLRDGLTVSFRFLPEGQDPDSLVRREGLAVFEKSESLVPLSQFLFDSLSQQADTKSLDGRARLAELAKPLIQKVPDGAYRDLLSQRLARLTLIEPAGITRPSAASYSRSRDSARLADKPARAVPLLAERALILLLEEPALAAEVDTPERFATIAEPGVDILVAVLKSLQANPALSNGAALIERWRDADAGIYMYLNSLYSRESITPPEGRPADFKGAIARLDRKLEADRFRQRLLGA